MKTKYTLTISLLILFISQACVFKIERALQKNVEGKYFKSKKILKNAVKEAHKIPISYHYAWGKHYLEGQHDTIQALRHFRKAYYGFNQDILNADQEVLQRNFIDRPRVVDYILACQNYPNVLPKVMKLQDSVIELHHQIAVKDSLIFVYQENIITALDKVVLLQDQVDKALNQELANKSIDKKKVEAQEMNIRKYKAKANEFLILLNREKAEKKKIEKKIHYIKQEINLIH